VSLPTTRITRFVGLAEKSGHKVDERCEPLEYSLAHNHPKTISIMVIIIRYATNFVVTAHLLTPGTGVSGLGPL
jgi:hypothetical protein